MSRIQNASMASVKQKKNWMSPAPTSATSASGRFSSPRQPLEIGREPDHGDAERHDGEGGVHEPRRGVEVKAVEPVAERLEQERVDAALADVVGDLEVVLVGRRGRVDEDHGDEVGDHALEGVAGERLLAVERGLQR